MALSNRDRIGRAFELFGTALDEFHTYVLAKEIPAGQDWTALLALKDSPKSGSGRTYSRTDPQNGLRMVTEQIPNQLRKGWYPYSDHLSRTEQSWATELRDVRNTWAHNGSFTADDAYRALDTAERFLRAIGAPDAADEVRRSRIDLMRLSSDKEDRKVVKASPAAEVGSAGLEPWRLVLRPHEDVASGNFHAAEFAADLAMVSRGEGDSEYTDPIEFFQRTFLTEGLRDLTVRAVKRLSGDLNAAPIINLQTNFGGGKTHSMLAVWHLASGRPLADYPQEVQDVLAGQELPKARRVALVGTQIQAGAVKEMADGTKVNTLWGLMAWQLGGREAYEIIRQSDEARTNPGDALRQLFQQFGPAVILIDEWVAYARQLYGREDLPDGTFDTQFTFAQALTEAAKAVPGTLVLISIPASAEMKDGEYVGDEEEVGGENGREALKMLRKAVGRVADQWRAANAEESFEIVRRRLFETPDSQAIAKINATSQKLVDFYRDHRSEFPREVLENDYLDRIRRCYPIHPELFDRLYEDWSTLDKFQRTRGVLRLMNTIVGQLWRENDTAPLIMPGSVPLRADKVVTELAQYLDDKWKALIDTDVDGPNSAPAQVDKANTLLGTRLTTQRLARTVFMGATPTLRSAHKGLDKQRVFLGTAMPGDVPGNFHSALNHLANTATYFYNSESLYWYDTQANTTRTARDHAERLHKEEVWNEVIKRLQTHRKTAADGFTAVHVAPESSADVPDQQEVRLVIVPPSHTHTKTDSDAVAWARDVTEHRGNAARSHRNMVTFLAADATRWKELDTAVRDFLAWSYVRDNADKSLGLTFAQREQAVDRVAMHDRTVRDRLLETYQWVLAPTQPDATRPLTIEAKKDSSGEQLAVRAAARLRNEGWLTIQRGPALIRHDLDGRLRAAWERDGHLTFGQLFGFYTTYPYLARLRDRTVLEEGALSVFDELIWQQTGFAFADSWDGTDYVGLVLPSDKVTPPQMTDSLLLVQPARAEAQRKREIAAITPPENSDEGATGADTDPETNTEAESGETASGTSAVSRAGGKRDGGKPVVVARKNRFFGSTELNSDFYVRDFNKITNEIIQHLAAADGVQLEVRIEITATTPTGFDDNKIRTVSENATVLKFDQAGFEIE
ncbi:MULTISPECIES: Swt1 family HEPN domain-containing protein [unclassified Rhodococcus (in: high G+C Gram-positive bacteria)]|uniref:Swt1 family HEPN domain-containing protein n=1 Tax=unclassified Rhodococcus (in: high G+C Gram-positive bacteria) TaxID=192944 RepID=UPI00096A8C18|nr:MULTISPECIES: Swt1 family HEPN domain-containing protein [unclassified Rhodococcus (in: high G+C Gram-positive bacteria)]